MAVSVVHSEEVAWDSGGLNPTWSGFIPDEGNVLVFVRADRAGYTAPYFPDGWTVRAESEAGNHGETWTYDGAAVMTKTSDGTETGITFSQTGSNNKHQGYIVELAGADESTIALGSWTYGLEFDASMETAAVTPDVGLAGIVFGFFIHGHNGADLELAAGSGYTGLWIDDDDEDAHPHTVLEYKLVNPASGTYSPDATAASGNAWQSVAFSLSSGPLAECEAPVSYDVYSLGDATSPALTYLATLCDAFDKSFRVELDGTGSGKFSINRSSSDATAAILGDGDGDVRYVQVRIPGITGWDTARFGFFIEEGDFRLLDSDEEGGETLKFSGHGSLAYLDFAVMGTHSYITGGMDPYTGLWRLYLAGTGSKPGQMLGRIIEEAQDAGRPTVPLPLLTDTFDYTNDSNAAAWASSTATDEFAAQIGESLLSVAGRLIGTGALTIQMSPTFVLSAYNTFGTDRSSTTFAANKVRFVGGTNIAEGLSRQVRPTRVATHEWVYGEAEASAVTDLADAATRVTREAFLSTVGSITATLEAVGDADLAERLLRSESLSVRIALGDDDSTGLYMPWDDFWVGDTVTLHTGTGEFDYDNVAFKVAAINVIEGPAAKLATDLEVRVELGSTQMSPGQPTGTSISASPGGGSSSVPFHSHPSSSTVSAWKEPVRAASTGNLTISGPGATIDGVAMAAQDRFLAKDQTAGAENGIYVWLGAATAAVRAADFASGAQALGAIVPVTEGTINADRVFVCTTNEAITLGTTALAFKHLALLPFGGGEDDVFPHGSMGAAETFDPADGNWHHGTFDAACTFTFTAPRSGRGCTLLLELAQNGTGGFAVTLPASFSNKAALEAAQITTASTTSFLLAWTRDGGTTWYGQWVGSSGSALTIEDEGTPLATAATTLDFVGAGVTASGTGAEKTITIPGDAAHIADTTDAHDASAISFSPTGTIAATDVQAAIAEVASEAGTSGDKFVVDPGSPSYAGTGPTVTLTSVFGITSGGAPYYNAANVTSGEEAALMRDPTSGSYFLRDYNF
jgi:hypothetical protein